MKENFVLLQHNFKRRTSALKIIALLCAPLILLSAPMGLERPGLDLVLENLGRSLVILGIFGRLWAFLHIAGKKSKVLVVTGPYALCRHPLYFFSLLIAIGAGLLLENPPLSAFVVVVFLWCHSLAVEQEEKKLLERFGAHYQVYRNQTPKLIPEVGKLRGSFRPTEGQKVDAGLVARHLLEAIGLMFIIPLAEIMEEFHRIGVLPDLWRF